MTSKAAELGDSPHSSRSRPRHTRDVACCVQGHTYAEHRSAAPWRAPQPRRLNGGARALKFGAGCLRHSKMILAGHA